MKIKAVIVFSLLVLILALPMMLRRQSVSVDSGIADDSIVILSPHHESIRKEFGDAFAAYWKSTRGRTLRVDWRSPGGASEIRMLLDSGYKAAAETGRRGIGVDVLFGGGEPDFSEQARKHRLEKLEVFDRHAEWFGNAEPIPETFTGERFYAADHVWVGTCLSQFGICYNPDGLKRLQLPCPVSWRDLGDPRYLGTLALADPTKSGSVARAFEMLVQSEMLRELKQHPDRRQESLEIGWRNGLRLIQQLAANARYFTDSASKIPYDVGQGNAVAGMCIDFYGRSYAADLTTVSGAPRMVWIAPQVGTTLSADPVAVLTGGPRPDIAQAFVEYCLTMQAQNLWFATPGTPGGTVSRALHRLPIRRDAYTPEMLATSTMPNTHPYEDFGDFIYQPELTGAAFNTLRQLVRVMCIDSHDEMKSAWSAMRDAGMPDAAMGMFADVSIADYATFGHGYAGFDSGDPLKSAENAARIGGWFKDHYRRAELIARQTKTASSR